MNAPIDSFAHEIVRFEEARRGLAQVIEECEDAATRQFLSLMLAATDRKLALLGEARAAFEPLAAGQPARTFRSATSPGRWPRRLLSWLLAS